MRIYCMSDIHGCLAEFEEALSKVLDYLEEEDTDTEWMMEFDNILI